MKLVSSIVSGLAGAIVIRIIQAAVRNRKSDAHKAVLNGHIKHDTHKSRSVKWTKVGLYLAGAALSAAIARWLEHQDEQHIVSPLNPPIESYKPIIDITV